MHCVDKKQARPASKRAIKEWKKWKDEMTYRKKKRWNKQQTTDNDRVLL